MSNEYVIIQKVDEVSVYQNSDKDIVICQKSYPEDDHIIIIPRMHIQALIDRLMLERDNPIETD